MRDNNGKPFITALYNVLLALDLCNKLFSIITLMNLVHTWIFRKGFCMVLFSDKKQNVVTLRHSIQRKIYIFGTNEGKFIITKANSLKESFLGVIPSEIKHRSTRLLLVGYASNVCQEIELRLDPDPYCSSCQTSTINKMLYQRHLWNPRHLSNGCSYTSYQTVLLLITS